MAMGFPVAVVYGLFSIFGAKAAAILTALGLGTVVGYGRGFGVPVTARVYWNKFKAWANEDSDAAIAALEDIFDGVMYGGSILLVLVFFGYFIQKFTEAGCITDIYALPVFGNIIKAIADALGVAGSLVMVAFLLAIMVPVIVLVTRLSRKATPSRD